jgi:XTP/dITP diphosphohydrolase
MQLCFATNNKHKLDEVAKIVDNRFTILSLNELSVMEELPETQNTFQGNALQKAQFLYDKLKIPCFADDSGLEVDALNGEPGVISAMYAGPQRSSEDNMQLLLNRLGSSTNRNARFRTIIALVGLQETILFEGAIEGAITYEKRGALGFGYDPIFIPKGCSKTFAEMPVEEKNKMSHRAIATQKLVTYLKNISL